MYTKDDSVTINKLWVLCCVCKRKTYEGIRQTRIYSPVGKKSVSIDLYMCGSCLAKGEPWPGVKPYSGISDKDIQGELDRFKDNTKIFED